MFESKKNRHTDTEDKILNAAREVFMLKGLEGARMQEIADAAGINKALLHYYFRSKENLFMEIIKRTTSNFFPSIINIWGKDIPFEKKVRDFTSEYIGFILQNPELPRFFINVLYQNPEMLLSVMQVSENAIIENFQKVLHKEAKRGIIKKVDAKHFIITILSLCIFPAIANPLLRFTFDINEEEYAGILEERKKIVPEIILSWLNFNKKK